MRFEWIVGRCATVSLAATSPMLLVAGVLVAGCAAEEESVAAGPVVRDSGGVTIVDNGGLAGGRLLIDTVPEIVIASAPGQREGVSDPEEVPLSGVGDVDVLSDGRIAVADPVPREVVEFNPSGAFVGRFGGSGGGPGEFARSIERVDVCGGDSIVVSAGGFLHVFDDAGRYRRRIRWRSPDWSAMEAVSTDCGRILVWRYAHVPPPDEVGAADALFVWLDPVSGQTDSVATLPTAVWSRRLYGMVRHWWLPWSASAQTVATAGDAVVVGYPRVPELRLYDASGALATIVRWRRHLEPITPADVRTYTRMRAEWLAKMPDDPEARFLFPSIAEYPELPSDKPNFERVLVDDEGTLWALAFPPESLGSFEIGKEIEHRKVPSQTWMLFDARGAWLGQVTLPPAFDLRVVAHGRAYGVAKDAFDVEMVRAYRILGPS